MMCAARSLTAPRLPVRFAQSWNTAKPARITVMTGSMTPVYTLVRLSDSVFSISAWAFRSSPSSSPAMFFTSRPSALT